MYKLLGVESIEEFLDYWYTMPPDEIVPRRGPPSVDYVESDKKVNLKTGGPGLKPINFYMVKGVPTP